MLTSPAFKDGGKIPVKYTGDGEKLSPPLKWGDPPKGTKSFTLLMDDLDVPKEYGGIFIHWMVYDIPANARELAEGASNAGKLPSGAKEVPNFFTQMGAAGAAMTKYGPPWPPTPNHRYRFILYALKVDKLGLAANATYPDFQKAVKDNMIQSWTLIGVFGPAKTPLPM
jgi:Raf kinase inhibitor-like YbhB/YbcL family protein